MSGGTHLGLPISCDPEAELGTYLRRTWSSDLRIGRVTKIDSYRRRVSIDARAVDLIFDRARRKRIFACHTIENLGEFYIRAAPKKWMIEGPSYDDFLKIRSNHKLSVLSRSESALIEVASDKFVEMGLVKNALTPVANLLIWLGTENSVSLENWKKSGRSLDQMANYLHMLERLGYVKMEKGLIVPGPEFPNDFGDVPPKVVYAQMLARAVREDHVFMQQVLRLTQIVGPLHWANSYYLTALLAAERISLPIQQLEQRHIGYYPARGTSELQRRGQLLRVVYESGIMQGNRSQVSGDPEVTKHYFEATAGSRLEAAV
ncbi:MAG TPA: hypothetical protein VML94_08590 [Thermoplasmata archaeon]|nr:hypothetical protein [Thermoplasmata archaeon]